jgi:hypothetical protein
MFYLVCSFPATNYEMKWHLKPRERTYGSVNTCFAWYFCLGIEGFTFKVFPTSYTSLIRSKYYKNLYEDHYARVCEIKKKLKN